jgi:hypothetical protein
MRLIIIKMHKESPCPGSLTVMQDVRYVETNQHERHKQASKRALLVSRASTVALSAMCLVPWVQAWSQAR